jgi:hypothetical protein
MDRVRRPAEALLDVGVVGERPLERLAQEGDVGRVVRQVATEAEREVPVGGGALRTFPERADALERQGRVLEDVADRLRRRAGIVPADDRGERRSRRLRDVDEHQQGRLARSAGIRGQVADATRVRADVRVRVGNASPILRTSPSAWPKARYPA